MSFLISADNVATVDGEKVTAVAAGEFTLTATFTLGKKTKEYTHTITVLNAEFNINYNLNEGVLPSDAPSKYNVKNLPLTLVNPTREGYIFSGWYTSEDFSGNQVTEIAKGSTGEVNLYAKWEEKRYKVADFDVNKLYRDYLGTGYEQYGSTTPYFSINRIPDYNHQTYIYDSYLGELSTNARTILNDKFKSLKTKLKNATIRKTFKRNVCSLNYKRCRY